MQISNYNKVKMANHMKQAGFLVSVLVLGFVSQALAEDSECDAKPASGQLGTTEIVESSDKASVKGSKSTKADDTTARAALIQLEDEVEEVDEGSTSSEHISRRHGRTSMTRARVKFKE